MTRNRLRAEFKPTVRVMRLRGEKAEDAQDVHSFLIACRIVPINLRRLHPLTTFSFLCCSSRKGQEDQKAPAAIAAAVQAEGGRVAAPRARLPRADRIQGLSHRQAGAAAVGYHRLEEAVRVEELVAELRGGRPPAHLVRRARPLRPLVRRLAQPRVRRSQAIGPPREGRTHDRNLRTPKKLTSQTIITNE